MTKPTPTTDTFNHLVNVQLPQAHDALAAAANEQTVTHNMPAPAILVACVLLASTIARALYQRGDLTAQAVTELGQLLADGALSPTPASEQVLDVTAWARQVRKM